MTKAAELAKIGEAITSGQIGGRRNLVINGAMQVNQRGTTDAVNGNGFPVDRFKCTVAALDQLVVALSQDSSAPAGFANSLKIEISTVEDALAVNETFVLETRLESQNLLQVQKGTATAKTMSLTFYVKSSVTGNYALQALDSDNGRSVAFLYAISVADTWEKKSILIPADTTGAFADDNGIGLSLVWFLAAGTNFTSGTLQSAWAGTTNANLAAGHNVNIMANTDNNWSLTGVQLEVGSVATPFEHRSFGEELALCQRYFQDPKLTSGNYLWLYPIVTDGTGKYRRASYLLPTTMRADATATLTGATNGTFVNGHPAIEGNDHRHYIGLAGDTSAEGKYSDIRALTLDAEL